MGSPAHAAIYARDESTLLSPDRGSEPGGCRYLLMLYGSEVEACFVVAVPPRIRTCTISIECEFTVWISVKDGIEILLRYFSDGNVQKHVTLHHTSNHVSRVLDSSTTSGTNALGISLYRELSYVIHIHTPLSSQNSNSEVFRGLHTAEPSTFASTTCLVSVQYSALNVFIE